MTAALRVGAGGSRSRHVDQVIAREGSKMRWRSRSRVARKRSSRTAASSLDCGKSRSYGIHIVHNDRSGEQLSAAPGACEIA